MYVRRIFPACVKTVVGLGQTFVALDHQRRAESVIGLANGFEGAGGLEIFGERERAEAVGRRVECCFRHR